MANSVKKKAMLVANVLQYCVAHDNHEEFWHPVVRMLGDLRDTTYAGGMDHLWANEGWRETFLRYYRTGRLKRAQIEELYCRAVLAGLHNKVEQTDG